jgi:hypothetical protein
VARACQLIDETCDHVDYVDINMGCPIDIVSPHNKDSTVGSSNGGQHLRRSLVGLLHVKFCS